MYEFVGCSVQLSSKPGWPHFWHWLHHWCRYHSSWGDFSTATNV